MKEPIYDVIVIGAGPAGISAAIWCKRLSLNVLVLDKGEEPGGQLFRVGNPIIDYPGLWVKQGEELAVHFARHLRMMQIPTELNQEVLKVDWKAKSITTDKGSHHFRYLILATGARDRRLNIPGEAGLLRRKEQFSTTKELDRFSGCRVLVVGGGDRALEGALNISDVAEHTWLIHRSRSFRAREVFIEAVARHPRITVWMEAELKEIHEDESLKRVKISRNRKEMILPMDRVLIRIGMEPDLSLVMSDVKRDNRGYIAVDQHYRTSVPWLFAVGDVITPPEFRSISLAVGQGMVASKAIVNEWGIRKE